jgi:hypothetical protein
MDRCLPAFVLALLAAAPAAADPVADFYHGKSITMIIATSPGGDYDTRKLLWIGSTTSSPNLVNSWHTTSTGEEAQCVTDFIAGTPAAVVARAKALLEN